MVKDLQQSVSFILTSSGADLVEKYLKDGGNPNAPMRVPTNALTPIESVLSRFQIRPSGTFNTYTLLDYSCMLTNTTVTKLLLDKGADPNRYGDAGCTPLNTAIANNFVPNVKLLINHGAKINPGIPDQMPPLYTAAYVGSPEIVDLLIKKGAKVNNYSEVYSTALEVAAYFGHLEIIRHLIAAGADVTIQSPDGYLPAQTARSMNHADCAAVLEDAMAKRKAAGSGGLKK